MTWAVVVGYAKRYWWIGVFLLALGLLGYFADQVKQIARNWLAYKNPAVEIAKLEQQIQGLQKDLHVLETRKEIRKPDGTVEITTTTETTDKSIETLENKTQEDTKKKPVLVTSRLLSHSVSISSDLAWSDPAAGYTVRYRNLSGGVSGPLNAQTFPEFRDALRLKVSWGF